MRIFTVNLLNIGKSLLLGLCFAMLILPAEAQKQKISGTVTSQGIPMTGVTITVKGTQNGTITDAKGEYSITIPKQGAELLFSFLGYVSQNVKIAAGQTSLNVSMTEDATMLDGLVIVGYGTVSKRDLTGAVASVGAKQIERDASMSLETMLQGKIAGVSITSNTGEPGGGVTTRIRGQSSLNSGVEPLYIVDDVPIQTESTLLNHGGSSLSPLATIDPSDIVSVDVLKDAASASIYGSRAANGVIMITTRRGQSGAPDIKFNASLGISEISREKPVLNGREYADLILESYRNGNDSNPIWQVVDSLNPTTSADNDWQSMVYRAAVQQKYDVGVSGGTKNLRYALSANYTEQEGTVINTSYNRIGTRINVDYQANGWLKVGTSTSIAESTSLRTSQGNSEASVVAVLTYPSVFSAYNPDGSLIGRLSGKTSPYAAAMAAKRNSQNDRITTNEYAEFRFNKYLRAKINFAYDLSDTREDSFEDKILNSESQYKAKARLTRNSTWLNENMLFFNRRFGKHKLDAVVGYTQQKWQRQFAGIDGEGYSSGSITTINAASLITNAYTQNTAHSMISFVGRVNYDYGGKYFLTVSLRRDGSSRFGANNRFGNFPSAQFGWRFSDEAFLKDNSWLSNGKFRFSYALTGNESIPDFITHGSYTVNDNYMGQQAIYPSNLKNPNLTWETTRQYNVGLDLGFLQNRISLIVDMYSKQTSDLLFNVRLPQTSGFTTVWSNLGDLDTKGIEFNLNTVNLVGAFEWTSLFNIAFDRTIVVKLPDGADILSGRSIIREGEKVGSFYGWSMKGVYPTDYTKYSGGTYSCEWTWSKALHILRHNPKVAAAAYSVVEHCDWISALLTGDTTPERISRSRCVAGHKSMWNAEWGGMPSKEFLATLGPKLAEFRDTIAADTVTADRCVGRLCAEWAVRLGLKEGVAVGVGAIDCHIGAVGAGIAQNILVKVMGTSTCDVIIADYEAVGKRTVRGICGQVDGSVVPDTVGFEAGQSAFGDVYAWFKRLLGWSLATVGGCPEAEDKILAALTTEAEQLPLTEDDAVACDWFNGRRTPDANPLCKGAIGGLTLASTAPEIFKALVEATAFGSRAINERMADEGVRIDGIIAVGGIAKKSPFVMQIMADVMGVPIKVARSEQACALGAAMYAAVVAGLYPTIGEAQKAMSSGYDAEYLPDAARHAIYNKLYKRYLEYYNAR